MRAKFTYYRDSDSKSFEVSPYVMPEATRTYHMDVKWEPGKVTWRLWNGNRTSLLREGSRTENVPAPTATTRMGGRLALVRRPGHRPQRLDPGGSPVEGHWEGVTDSARW